MSSKRSKTQFATQLAQALRAWCGSENGVPLLTLRNELNVDQRTWRNILAGDRIIESRYTTIYPQLFRLTGLKEADPTNIPDRVDGRSRRWSLANLEIWWKETYPDEFDTPEVKRLIASTQAAIANGYTFDEITGDENEILQRALDLVSSVFNANETVRQGFCTKNRAIMKLIQSKLSILVQPDSARESIIQLQEVTHE